MVKHSLVVVVLIEASSALVSFPYDERGLVLVLLCLQVGSSSVTEPSHGTRTPTIVLL